MKNPVFFTACAVLCAALLPHASWAQWHWVDAQGHKVFSDRPPPMDIPEKDIVKRPAQRASEGKPVGSASLGESSNPGNEKAPAVQVPTAKTPGTEPELEARKAQAQAAQKAQQQADAERQALVRAENCARARQSKANLESGLPLMQINAQGYRVLMDEATKAAERQRAQSIIDSDCAR